MPDVLVTDFTFDRLDLEEAILAPLGGVLRPRQCRTEEALLLEVHDAEYVLTQFAPLTERVIGAMERARLIVRYGIGVDNVDLEAAHRRGVPVCNVPDYCIDEVADHTLAFLLAATRQVVPNCLGVQSGSWRLAVPLDQMRTLRTMTVGVVGFGRIGRAVVARLVPFGPRVLVLDPAVAPAEIESAGAGPADLGRILAEGDAITLHCPSTPATRRMIDAAALGRMRPGVILLNLSRGELVDTAALVEALRSGHVAAAALDVCIPEPIPPGHPLLGMPNVTLSAHVASASPRAVRHLRETAAQIVARRIRGESLPNVVNGVSTPTAPGPTPAPRTHRP
jgi:D-3-phosphoglycerate dehydrogenase